MACMHQLQYLISESFELLRTAECDPVASSISEPEPHSQNVS